MHLKMSSGKWRSFLSRPQCVKQSICWLIQGLICIDGSPGSSLVQVTAWHQVGAKPLPEPVITQITSTYMDYQASTDSLIFTNLQKYVQQSSHVTNFTMKCSRKTSSHQSLLKSVLERHQAIIRNQRYKSTNAKWIILCPFFSQTSNTWSENLIWKCHLQLVILAAMLMLKLVDSLHLSDAVMHSWYV